ncbi:MAG: hypothetical protein KA257_07820 [Opitutaceae bacterium]|nr:hypothetical protein [Opitutaceae bacterium]
MKKPTLLLTLGLSALALAGCSKSDRTEIKSDLKDTYRDAKVAAANAWSDLKDFSFEQRADFSNRAAAMTAKLDAEISDLKSDAADAKASASRSAAMDELRNARADLNTKLTALSHATADTWSSAKAEVIAAWEQVEAAYKKAKADHT